MNSGRGNHDQPPGWPALWLVAGVTDMRCSFNGLAAKMQNTLRTDPFSGNIVSLFCCTVNFHLY
ncbi:hypothetical protein TUM17576_49970 [Enterobacter hormaechei]|nr:hypothetical protein MRY16398_51440 [Phytobacter sp. MRY16-398]GJL38177.1 hypothetical protein TUM17576_49970 [Enterobacter hormaechei]GJL43650.1 hypothetical protein TUM17577_48590 [Enterobacter asburiae]